jgi:chromosome segregation ATPase
MSRADIGLIIMTIALLGAWGCSQGQSPGPSTSDRLKALELKNAKLEDDFRAVALARDQLRRKLAAAEEQQQQLQRQIDELQSLVRERDELRQQVVSRTSERDALINQLEQFRRNLKDLLGQVEVALPRATEPVTSASEVESPEKL